MMRAWNRNAQTTVEYAVLIVVVVGALLVMQIYMKRGFSGKLKESTDRTGEQFTPYSATYELDKSYKVTRSETTTVAGAVTTELSAPEIQTRSGSEKPVDTDMTTETLFPVVADQDQDQDQGV